MSRIEREKSRTGFYHVMQRGVGKQIIFEDKYDYYQYLNKIEIYKEKFSFELIAYCLMDNHVHLLIKTEDIQTLSNIMLSIGTSYARYFNEKYERSGHVFQGRFLSEPINDERYFLACVRYIHNNPVKAGLAARESYAWSSYYDYVAQKRLVDTGAVLDMLGDRDTFISFSKIESQEKFIECYSESMLMENGRIIIENNGGCTSEGSIMVGKLVKKERDRILRLLKEEGLKSRQIERLTGVSKKIIQRA